ncbi:NAD(P)H-dependent flavin oxidoreductase [Lentibacillus juripiscarius]|uniref:Probable nitronate monooxygenase n=1 Tax=Lentibacillus juripiscarius TaxID=257446 RepID=A0ABW5V8Z3_9BACI
MNRLLDKLQIEVPIIQAGMAGGITTPELVATVANEGALGTIGAGYMDGTSLKEDIRKVKQLTDQPFAVNLFAVNMDASSADIQPMQRFLDGFRNELGADPGASSVHVYDHLDQKINVILEENIPIVSTAFGMLGDAHMERLQNKGVTLIGMATNPAEARQLEDAGYDVIVAQGVEAGGHRGTFNVENFPYGSTIGLLVLVQEIVAQVRVPVVAAGGIHSKSQMDALLAMGAAGVQLGTRFLVAKEAGTNTAYRQALISADTGDTAITKVFSGRPARAIRNRFVQEVETSEIEPLPYPIQNQMTKDIRAAAKQHSLADMQSLWAGQGVGLIEQEEPAAVIVRSFV